MANNVNWGLGVGAATILAPGDTAGEGRCGSGEWGVRADDVVVYSSLRGLRKWAQSVLDSLPSEREAPLIVVNEEQQRQWLNWSGVLEAITVDNDQRADAPDLARNLVIAVAADPAAAGWTLGEGVASVWAELDDDGGVVAGVQLITPDVYVGIGEPLVEKDLRFRFLSTPAEQAAGCLRAIAARINQGC